MENSSQEPLRLEVSSREEQPTGSASKKSSHAARWVMLSGLVAVGVALGLFSWFQESRRLVSKHAQVEGELFTVAATASGTVAAVPVAEGQSVQARQVQLNLDDIPLQTALTQAEAALQTVLQGGTPPALSSPADREAEEAANQAAKAGRQEEDAARLQLEHWTAEHARAMIALRDPAATAGPAREQAIAAESSARASMEQARQLMENAARKRAAAETQWRRLREVSRMELSGAGLVAAWEARVAQARHDLAGAVVTAPFAGRVVWLSAHPGQRVNRGDALLTLAPQAESGEQKVWVTAAFDSRQMLELRIGQTCRVELDEGKEVEGVITALLPDENGGLARISLTYDNADPVWPGQKAVVKVKAD